MQSYVYNGFMANLTAAPMSSLSNQWGSAWSISSTALPALASAGATVSALQGRCSCNSCFKPTAGNVYLCCLIAQLGSLQSPAAGPHVAARSSLVWRMRQLCCVCSHCVTCSPVGLPGDERRHPALLHVPAPLPPQHPRGHPHAERHALPDGARSLPAHACGAATGMQRLARRHWSHE